MKQISKNILQILFSFIQSCCVFVVFNAVVVVSDGVCGVGVGGNVHVGVGRGGNAECWHRWW